MKERRTWRQEMIYSPFLVLAFLSERQFSISVATTENTTSTGTPFQEREYYFLWRPFDINLPLNIGTRLVR